MIKYVDEGLSFLDFNIFSGFEEVGLVIGKFDDSVLEGISTIVEGAIL